MPRPTDSAVADLTDVSGAPLLGVVSLDLAPELEGQETLGPENVAEAAGSSVKPPRMKKEPPPPPFEPPDPRDEIPDCGAIPGDHCG